MISKAEYKILNELKNGSKPRESFEDTKTVDLLISNGYIQITYGKMIKDTEKIPLYKNHKLVVSATFEQFLELTEKGIKAIAEYRKHLMNRIFHFFQTPLSFITETIFDYVFPKVIRIFQSRHNH